MANTLMLNDRAYNTLKWAVQIVLPAFGTLYFALGGIWNWSNVESVLGTVTAVSIFLGTTMGISGHYYNKESVTASTIPDGTLNLSIQEDGTTLFDLDAKDTLNDLANKESVVFKISDDR